MPSNTLNTAWQQDFSDLQGGIKILDNFLHTRAVQGEMTVAAAIPGSGLRCL